MKSAKSTSPGTASFSGLINAPGTFMQIPIVDLKIDTEYQRPLSGNRVDRISSDWSYIACGCITVALRGAGSGEYYVIDGQHRVAAAERAGLPDLPCLVFETKNHIDEAQGFLDTNTSRKAMSTVDRYRALLVVNDPGALKLKALLDIANRDAGSNATNSSVKCIEFLLRAIQIDVTTLETIWPLVTDLSESRPLLKKMVQGMFYLERYLTNTSLMDRHWRKRLMTVGYDGLVKSIDETCTYEGKSGGAICANGIIRAINKGLRNKIRVEVSTKEPEND